MNFEWSTENPEICILNAGGRWNRHIVREEFSVKLGTTGLVVSFPVGWTTDFTSSPAWARGFVSQLGAHAPASLIHDRLLDLGHPREFARNVMNEQLKELSLVPIWRRQIIVLGVFFNDQLIRIKKS